MAPYVPFSEIKARVSIKEAADWLGIAYKQSGETLRAQCPVNTGEKREMVITPAKGLFNCFGCRAGGDVISLVAHIKGVSMKDAAMMIHDKFMQPAPAASSKVLESPPTSSNVLDKIAARLAPEHQAVQSMGFPPDIAKALSVGFDARGYHRGLVAILLRNPDGSPAGFIGLEPGTKVKLPPKWET